MKLVNVYYGHLPAYNIDANKHPDLQLLDLKNLLENSDDVVNIYCNSPYVLFGVTLIHAYTNSKIPAEFNPYSNIPPITNKHFEIKENGDIIEGTYYNNMINDENLLKFLRSESNLF